MSNITGRRPSAVTRALLAAHPGLAGAANLPKHQFLFDTNGPLFRIPNFALPTKKALPFFYSIQMKSHQALITNHCSPKHGDSKWPKN